MKYWDCEDGEEKPLTESCGGQQLRRPGLGYGLRSHRKKKEQKHFIAHH